MTNLYFFGFECLTEQELEETLNLFNESNCAYKFTKHWSDTTKTYSLEVYGEEPVGLEDCGDETSFFGNEFLKKEFEETFTSLTTCKCT